MADQHAGLDMTGRASMPTVRATLATGERHGPVNALDYALRHGTGPEIEKLELITAASGILDALRDVDATRVLTDALRRPVDTDHACPSSPRRGGRSPMDSA